ncbi:fibronectin type III domain-containing protein [Propionispora hippei]|uniref:Fibronectin type-III domain-containing protein n=1 Tax=Propionispora hippei DSM 15287 TaxID=1123003 RepID=A0A1M6CYL9_9FIRM|nr:fibronectin type III domain-containing protein [Propionispora hippei]SHI65951.1 hypothetical protein SAMN02745170_00782 [Propionispora hippei DSM 15287]
MATVGQSLTAPESGWQRFGSSESRFIYNGTWSTDVNVLYYNGSQQGTTELNASIVFKFTGTKLRIITDAYPDHSTDVQIEMDGEASHISLNAAKNFQRLSFEKVGLSLQSHRVVITNLTNKGLGFSAIDIDDTGYLETVIQPTILKADSGDSQVTLNWDVVTGANGYNVKRSLTAGGPYETIATSVPGTSYVDTNVVNGTTYYYVVTGVNADGESANSNEASATPQALGKVLLLIELTDGLQKEYELTKSELDTFVNWYNNRSISAGQPYYIFDKSFNLGPFDSREDYLVFDKIQNFEVMTFIKQ